MNIGMGRLCKDSEGSRISTQSPAIFNTHHVRLFNGHSLLLWVSNNTSLAPRPLTGHGYGLM
jgi:hypothetical protein